MPGLEQGKPMPGVGLSLEVLDQQCAWTRAGKPMPGVGLSLEVLDQQCAWTRAGEANARSRTGLRQHENRPGSKYKQNLHCPAPSGLHIAKTE